jgi:PKD repeat protein
MNNYDGIDVQGGGSNQILNNHIACNGYNGIQLGNATNGNIIKGNIIGPLMGTCTFNGYRGIDIEGGSTNNIVGGTTPSEANKIAGNDYWGIEVKDAGTTGNILSGNSMSCNAYDAIDINTGGNNNIIPPSITVANATTVSGTSTANAIIEVFRSQQAGPFGCVGTPNTQGADYLGTTTANGSGAWSLTGVFDGYITATQRTAADGSSKYCIPVNTGITATVGNGCSGPVVGAGSAPSANFSVSTDTICAGDCIDFTDLSSNAPTSWAWTLTGGTPSSSTAQDPTACYNAAGNYTAQLAATNANGTGNTTKTIVVLALPLITISQNGTLLAATTGHPSYQWYMNGNIIPGATGDTVIISFNGNYTCIATGSNGCTDTSAMFPVTNMGLNDISLSHIRLYPNPANEEINLDLGMTVSVFSIAEIIDITGKILQVVNVNQSLVRIETSALAPGMYMVKLRGNTDYVIKFSKL